MKTHKISLLSFASFVLLSAISTNVFAAGCSSIITARCPANSCKSADVQFIGAGDWPIPQGCSFNMTKTSVQLKQGDAVTVGTYTCNEVSSSTTGTNIDPQLKVEMSFTDINGKSYPSVTSENTIYCGQPACGTVIKVVNPSQSFFAASTSWGAGECQ